MLLDTRYKVRYNSYMEFLKKKKQLEKHVCDVCGTENSEIFCPKCKTFQIEKDRWDIEPIPEEAVGPIPKGYALSPPEYHEGNDSQTTMTVASKPVPLHVLHSVAKYRYWPALSSLIASLFLLLLPLIPVGNKSAIVNADIEIVLYSLFGVLSAFAYFACGVYRMFKAVKDPFEKCPILTIIQGLLLALDAVMFSLIIAYGHVPHDPISLWITISVATTVGIVVLVYVIMAVSLFMISNTYKRRVVAEKFRRELKSIPQEFSKGKKLLIFIMGAFMVVTVILASVISATVGTSQIANNMPEAIDMGATYEEAERILGEPHLIDENVWYYYTNNYYLIHKKIIATEKQGKDTTELREQLSKIEYSQLQIFFDDEGKYYLGIYYDSLIDGKPVKEQRMLFATAYSSHTVMGELEYYVKLSDGSVEYGLLKDYTVTKSEDGGSAENALTYVNVHWSGYLGDYTVKIPERLLPEDKRPIA